MERIPKLIMEWTPTERRKSGRPRKTWVEGVQAAMATRNLEPDQWRNREECSLVCGRWRQLLWNRIDIGRIKIEHNYIVITRLPQRSDNKVGNVLKAMASSSPSAECLENSSTDGGKNCTCFCILILYALNTINSNKHLESCTPTENRVFLSY